MHVCKTEQFPTYKFILSLTHIPHRQTLAQYINLHITIVLVQPCCTCRKQKLLLIFATISVGRLIYQ